MLEMVHSTLVYKGTLVHRTLVCNMLVYNGTLVHSMLVHNCRGTGQRRAGLAGGSQGHHPLRGAS